MTGSHEPTLLYSVNNILAYDLHVNHGSSSGQTREARDNGTPQTLSLMMVPTPSGFDSEDPQEDFYLHLMLKSFDLPLPATTQIYHKPPSSYLIPRWDLGDGSGFLELEFPKIGKGITQEDLDTFETILAQCTAFLERAQPPTDSATKKYDPSAYKPGEAYVKGTGNRAGQIVLVDEENGSVMGELAEGAQIVEHPGIEHGSKSMESPQSRFSEQFPKLTVYRSC